MRLIQIPLYITLLALCGCGNDVRSIEAQEEREPLIKQGQAFMERKDYPQAITAFEQAIENEPRMARPYLDLATIFHQYQPDYVSSIYYYKRYIALRPDSEKIEFIKEQVDKVQVALAHAILTQSGAFRAIQERDQLLKENAELKRELAATREINPPPTGVTKSVTQTIPKKVPSHAASSTHQIYTVLSGDNLTKIAKKFYPDGDYTAIYEANRDRMKSPGDLRVGQTLVIPNR